MATLNTQNLPLIILFFISLLYALLINSASAANKPGPNFIRTSCRATRYPAVCFNSLSPYASTVGKSPRQMAMMALSVSVKRARSARSFVARLARLRGLKPRESAAIKDCLEEVSEGVDRLSKSVSELKISGRAGSPEFRWHLSNLQTWASGALTDEGTCADGFSGRAVDGRIKSSVRARMAHVGQVTSNALALCNKLVGGN